MKNSDKLKEYVKLHESVILNDRPTKGYISLAIDVAGRLIIGQAGFMYIKNDKNTIIKLLEDFERVGGLFKVKGTKRVYKTAKGYQRQIFNN